MSTHNRQVPPPEAVTVTAEDFVPLREDPQHTHHYVPVIAGKHRGEPMYVLACECGALPHAWGSPASKQ